MAIPGYRAGLDELESRSMYPEALYNFCNQRRGELEEHFGAATSCLSVGAGHGEVDSFLIRKLMPSLRTYHAVEPDPENMHTLHENIGKVAHARADLSTYFYTEDANTWDGIGQQADVILCLCMLSHIKDIKDFLRKCQSWLNPGGTFVS